MKLFSTKTTFDVKPLLAEMISLSAQRLTEIKQATATYSTNDAVLMAVPSFGFGRCAGHTTAAVAYAVHHPQTYVVTPNIHIAKANNAMCGKQRVAICVHQVVNVVRMMSYDERNNITLIFDSCKPLDIERVLVDGDVISHARAVVMLNTNFM